MGDLLIFTDGKFSSSTFSLGRDLVTIGNSQLLASWEYEGEVPQVILEGEFLHDGNLTRFEMLKRKDFIGTIVFRQGDDDGSWAVNCLSNQSVEGCISCISSVLRNGKFMRKFWIGAEQIKIFPNGNGGWGDGYLTEGFSHFSMGRSIAKLSSSQTYQRFQALLARRTSDVAWAQRFSQSSENQKWCRVFGLASEEELSVARAEMERLCQLVLYANKAMWRRKTSVEWEFRASTGELSASFFIDGLPQRKSYSSATFLKWVRAIERLGPLRPRLAHLCLRRYFERHRIVAGGRLVVPSSDEQLEARLELKAWSQAHLPPDVLAEMRL